MFTAYQFRSFATAIANVIGILLDRVISSPMLIACTWAGSLLTSRRFATGRIRTLWGITPILTLPLKAQSDRALGFTSESLVLTNYHITSEFTWNLKWIRFLIPNSRLQSAVLKLVLTIALLRYDIVHYFADRGILPPENGRFGIHPGELRALHLAGKSVYVFAYGADVRTRRKTLCLGEWNFCRDCDEPGRFCICDDEQAISIMHRTGALINRFVAMGDMLEYLPRPIHLDHWPIDTEKIVPVSMSAMNAPLKVLHAPNHTHFKGTRYLERSIRELNEFGDELDLVMISGVSNREVIERLAEADVVVDQLLGGAYGYTALEAMARGKPVITYVRDSRLIIGFDDCPLINATPDTIKDVLFWCLRNRSQLEKIGRQGRRYIERYHSVSAVAARFAQLYCDTMPLSPPLIDRLVRFQDLERERSGRIPSIEGWEHRWRAPTVNL